MGTPSASWAFPASQTAALSLCSLRKTWAANAEQSLREALWGQGQSDIERQKPYNRRLSLASTSPLNVHLEQYEGPLDLLLDLIRKQQIDIRDIPIATITSQYLAFLEQAREMDLDIGAEFVFMAATLIHIKSRMLLPTDPALRKEGEAEEDPREELVQRLLEHKRFKDAAEMLQQKRHIEENVWSNPQIKEFAPMTKTPGWRFRCSIWSRRSAKFWNELKDRPVYEVNEEEIKVTDMVRHVRSLLEHTRKDKPLFILQLMEKQRSRRAMICLFLAILEMVKTQTVQILQKDLFGEIALGKGDRFDETPLPLSPPNIEEEYK